jgi:hypothetical protein
MKYQKVNNTNFFDPENYAALINRLDSIQPNAKSKWGTMNVTQMLHHLNLAIGSGLGFYELPEKSSVLSRGFIQFVVLNVLKRFPRSAKTPSPLEVKDEYNFEVEKAQLKKVLSKAFATESDVDWGKHTYFGSMTRSDWGKLIIIHCNHHFQQFGY